MAILNLYIIETTFHIQNFLWFNDTFSSEIKIQKYILFETEKKFTAMVNMSRCFSVQLEISIHWDYTTLHCTDLKPPNHLLTSGTWHFSHLNRLFWLYLDGDIQKPKPPYCLEVLSWLVLYTPPKSKYTLETFEYLSQIHQSTFSSSFSYGLLGVFTVLYSSQLQILAYNLQV